MLITLMLTHLLVSSALPAAAPSQAAPTPGSPPSSATGPSPASPASPAAQKLAQEGADLYRQGNLGEALLKFEEAVKGGAEGGEMFYRMAYCYRVVRSDEAKSREYTARAVPLLEIAVQKDAESKNPSPQLSNYYYLAAASTHDLDDSAKGTTVAHQGIALVERGAFGAITGSESLFQVSRLYSLSGQQEKSVEWYERTLAALDSEKSPDPERLASSLEKLSSAYVMRGDYGRAADLLERLVTTDPSRQRETLAGGMMMIRAGRYKEAVSLLSRLTDDEMATEANYIMSVLARYEQMGGGPLPESVTKLDDTALSESTVKAARRLAEIRQQEEKADPEEPAPELPYDWKTTKSGTKAKIVRRVYPPEGWQPKDPNNPTMEELDYMMGIPPPPKKPPAPPASAERLAAEKEFFTLLVEQMRRGRRLRDTAFTHGFTGLIFR